MSDLKTARDFMRSRLVTLDPHATVLVGVDRLLKNNISGAPVMDSDGQFLGVFSEKCSMNALTAVVEVADQMDMHVPWAREFMACGLTTL